MSKSATKVITGDAVREIRRKLGLNQQAFWSLLGVTQSGGSRYESGRSIPKPVQNLVRLAYGSDKEANAAFADLRAHFNVKKKEASDTGSAEQEGDRQASN